jgi:P27 family predicted phage terminase small subunit
MAGRKPLPDAVKQLRGTDQPVRMSKSVTKLTVQIPEPPEYLSERAKEAYWQLASVLHTMRIITIADKTALELLCESYATYRECYEFVQKNSRTYETYSTYPVRNAEGMVTGHEQVEGSVMYRPRPEVAMMNEAWKQVRSMLAEFGLTPSSRSKVSAMGENEEDPFDKFMSGN